MSQEYTASDRRAMEGVKGVRSTAEQTLYAFQTVEEHGPWPCPSFYPGMTVQTVQGLTPCTERFLRGKYARVCVATNTEEVRQKVGYTQRPLSVDALTRIARLEDPNLQSRLVDGVLAGNSQSEIREQIRQAHRGKRSRSATETNRTFHTRFGAVVTVHSKRGRLTDEQTVAALQEALDEATTASRVLGKRPA